MNQRELKSIQEETNVSKLPSKAKPQVPTLMLCALPIQQYQLTAQTPRAEGLELKWLTLKLQKLDLETMTKQEELSGCFQRMHLMV